MRPVKVEFQAFGPYAGYETVDFEAVSEKGLFLICGKTGMGKTMIIDAMTFALYGKSSGSGRDDFEAMRCTNADFGTATFVRFEFENNGEYYLFERRLERKVKKLSASYNVSQKGEDGVWRPLMENAKEKAVNAKAAEIIGLEFAQFVQVIVLPQGKFEKLLTSGSDEKEQILTSIFGEEKWQLIADRVYEEAAGRRESLKEKRDRITNSLKEENCETVSQLGLMIEQKEQKLGTLDSEYKSAGYEERMKKLQDKLALSKRFGDLHKAEKRSLELAGQKEEDAARSVKADNAARAGRVRDLLAAKSLAEAELRKRKDSEAGIRAKAADRAKAAEQAEAALKDHRLKAPETEEKKKLKALYEGKMVDYAGLDAAAEAVSLAEKAGKAAAREEEAAKKILDAFAPKAEKLRTSYSALNEEHRQLLEIYLAGITGELAERLEEGKPCPVCGSTSHPHKAVRADNSVSREMVDAKKEEAENEYHSLEEILNSQEAAKKEYEEKRAVREAGHAAVVEAGAKLDALKKNLVENIATGEELTEAIKELKDAITGYETESITLEEDEKAKKVSLSEAAAEISSAEKETQAASEKYVGASEAADKGLRENGFASEEEARECLLDEEETEKLRRQISEYRAEVLAAERNLSELISELRGIDEPDEDECRASLAQITESMSAYAGARGSLETEITRLKNKKNVIEAEGEGIEEEIREADEDYAFAKKLRGDTGTGLQRYVLGIMFSTVVAAANKMLELVHGGRYRLFRSDDKGQGNKRGLELKVYDRHSEDHEGRFVNTLSGGEKFLASLALSIGMSTVAQKSGIKIEALFIDEGFGSLDEDSIGDAMNILNSIQEANGLVGIISHVQLLQDRIPTKLMVEEGEKGSRIVSTIG